jgi:hypothetical protein
MNTWACGKILTSWISPKLQGFFGLAVDKKNTIEYKKTGRVEIFFNWGVL